MAFFEKKYEFADSVRRIVLRVIAGLVKGHRLKCLKGLETRPTRDQVREAVFSSLGRQTEGARGLDLFAGAGAMGIEALSRGAAEVVFVEKNPAAAAVIQANLNHCRLEKIGRVLVADAFDYAENFRKNAQEAFDLIFCDPPYSQANPEALLRLIDREHLLSPDGILVWEGPKSLKWEEYGEELILYKARAYGKTGVFYFGRRT